jgi:hypothetical protein
MASRGFDVIAIGTGYAASTMASRCHEAGWQLRSWIRGRSEGTPMRSWDLFGDLALLTSLSVLPASRGLPIASSSEFSTFVSGPRGMPAVI